MKNKLQLIMIVILACITQITFAQVKTLTNVRPAVPTNQLGWDGTGGNSGTLEIRNDFASDINFFTNGSQRATILSGGNVGINTTSPNNLFHVYDTKNATYSSSGVPTVTSRIENANNSQSNAQYATLGFSVISQTAGNVAGGYITLVQPAYTGKYGNLTFSLRNAAGNTNEIMRIQSDGYVGIGTTSPNNLLQVKDLVNFDNSNSNSFVGYQTGVNNVTGNQNSFFGYYAGNGNIKGINNTCIGYYTLANNNHASENVAIGSNALYTQAYNPVLGAWNSYNVAVGNGSLYANLPTSTSTGYKNTAVGYSSGSYNTTGNDNTYLGYGTGGSNNTTGSDNTFIGYQATENGNYSNATAIGSGASSTGNNIFYCGNANALLYCAQGVWTGSDGRFKFNVKEDVKGLEFINKLRPVTYQLDTKKLDGFINNGTSNVRIVAHTHTSTYTDSLGTHTNTTITYDTIAGYSPNSNLDFTASMSVIHSGFIAQEVEKAEKGCGFNSSIVQVPVDSNSNHYALSYQEIVVPLVKAVQQLSKIADSLQTQINALNGTGQRTTGDNTNPSTDIELASKSAILYQNMPNPFGDGTVVKYFVPENVASASIIFYDEFGTEMKNVELPNKGVTAELNLSTLNLASGIYSYSLVVNGKVIDTKKMVKTK